jgi:hypothetical protein
MRCQVLKQNNINLLLQLHLSHSSGVALLPNFFSVYHDNNHSVIIESYVQLVALSIHSLTCGTSGLSSATGFFQSRSPSSVSHPTPRPTPVDLCWILRLGIMISHSFGSTHFPVQHTYMLQADDGSNQTEKSLTVSPRTCETVFAFYHVPICISAADGHEDCFEVLDEHSPMSNWCRMWPRRL